MLLLRPGNRKLFNLASIAELCFFYRTFILILALKLI